MPGDRRFQVLPPGRVGSCQRLRPHRPPGQQGELGRFLAEDQERYFDDFGSRPGSRWRHPQTREEQDLARDLLRVLRP